ncbi:MAG: hemerythrin domain-containing protein [Candidatus Omnitrophica bacterium]|nr:hemerythrin domain-containing protein [Candidatus Omnitrophota bacterium]
MVQLKKNPEKSQTSKEVVRLLERGHADTLQKISQLEKALLNLRFEGKPSLGKNLRQAEEVLDFLRNQLMKHIRIEEKVIFPFLSAHIPKLESVIHLLEGEHDEFRKNVEDFCFELEAVSKAKAGLGFGRTLERAQETGTYLVYLLRNHIRAEHQSVYKVIHSELRPDEKKELARRITECKTHGGSK